MALIAIVCEVAFGGFAKENVVGGIKDISGVLIDVLVLFIAASAFIRKPVNFKAKFNKAMDSIKEKYNPLLVEDKKRVLSDTTLPAIPMCFSLKRENLTREFLNCPKTNPKRFGSTSTKASSTKKVEMSSLPLKLQIKLLHG